VTISEEIHGVFVFALKEKDKILCVDLHVKDLPWDHIEKAIMFTMKSNMNVINENISVRELGLI